MASVPRSFAAHLSPGAETGSCAVPHHNRDFALQKYLLLHEQHETLRQHLDELRPSFSYPADDTYSTSSTTVTPAASPTRPACSLRHHGHKRAESRRATMPQYQAPWPRLHHSRTGRGGSHAGVAAAADATLYMELETVVDENTLAAVAADEARLFDVNEGIKRALTELLNCEAVRGDSTFRTWVQCRLMDTERELRHGRRRRSCPIA